MSVATDSGRGLPQGSRSRRMLLHRVHTLLINTSRGELVDTKAIINALKSGQLDGLALDVYERYEQEADLFYRNLSSTVVSDDVFERLLTFPHVIVTGHQAFFPREAISTISETTIKSVTEFASDR